MDANTVVKNIPKTKLCKCGNEASFIKDYFVTESIMKRENTYADNASTGVESACGILRRRYCGDCISKIASQQRNFNKRLNTIILASVALMLLVLAGGAYYDYFYKGEKSALPFLVIITLLTVVSMFVLSRVLLTSQGRRREVENGNYSNLKVIEELMDSLNFGLDDWRKIKNIQSTDVIVDGDGKFNSEMERSGFPMKITFEGRISVEDMRTRIKYPFKENFLQVKQTYQNNYLLDDTIKAVDDKASKNSDFDIRNGTLFRYSGIATEIIIPHGVKKIAPAAFKNAKNCDVVVIPDTVEVIEKEAFSGCPAQSINIPEGITEIKPFTFYKSGVMDVILPESITEIGDSAFYSCFNLRKVYIPSECKFIRENAFRECSSLVGVTISEGVESIGDYAFNACMSLESVDIPEGVYEVGNFAFENCASLKELYLPDTIQFMGGRAFDGNIQMVVYGREGSYAEKFALQQRRRFSEIKEKNTGIKRH